MFQSLKERLVRGVVATCFATLNEKVSPIRFVPPTRHADFRELAREGSIYVIGKRSITEYYYYSEPGNPFLSEEYEDLSSFVTSMVHERIRSKVVTAAAFLSWNPDKCKFPELKKYLENNKVGDSPIERLMQGQEIQKFLTTLMYRKLEPTLSSSAFRFVNILVFGIDRSPVKGALEFLAGDWKAPNGLQRYSPGKYVVLIDEGKGVTREFKYEYSVIGETKRSLLIRTTPETGLDFEERLYFSRDYKRLKIYGYFDVKQLSPVGRATA